MRKLFVILMLVLMFTYGCSSRDKDLTVEENETSKTEIVESTEVEPDQVAEDEMTSEATEETTEEATEEATEAAIEEETEEKAEEIAGTEESAEVKEESETENVEETEVVEAVEIEVDLEAMTGIWVNTVKPSDLMAINSDGEIQYYDTFKEEDGGLSPQLAIGFIESNSTIKILEVDDWGGPHGLDRELVATSGTSVDYSYDKGYIIFLRDEPMFDRQAFVKVRRKNLMTLEEIKEAFAPDQGFYRLENDEKIIQNKVFRQETLDKFTMTDHGIIELKEEGQRVLIPIFKQGEAYNAFGVSLYPYSEEEVLEEQFDFVRKMLEVQKKDIKVESEEILGLKLNVSTRAEVVEKFKAPNFEFEDGDTKFVFYELEGFNVQIYFDSKDIVSEVILKLMSSTYDLPEQPEVVSSELFYDTGQTTIGFVTDVGGISDKSFNESTWTGLERFVVDKELPRGNIKYLESVIEYDKYELIDKFLADDTDLIMAAGFMMTDAINEAAQENPDQKFLVMDTIAQGDNVAYVLFSEEEGAYLMGVAAALKANESQSKAVGFIGGMSFPLIQKYQAGFAAGVQAVDPTLEIVVEYAGTFSDVGQGQIIASRLYDKGVSVIYHAAGGVGLGLIEEAKARQNKGEKVWVIGTDRDQSDIGFTDSGENVVLTSMVKFLDRVAYDFADKVYSDKFEAGEHRYGLSNGGVGLPEKNPNLSGDMLKRISLEKEKIIDGRVNVPVTP